MDTIEDTQTADQNVSVPDLKPKYREHNIRHQSDDSFDSDTEIIADKQDQVPENPEEPEVQTLLCPLCLKTLYLNTKTSSEKDCWESHFKMFCSSLKDEKAEQQKKLQFCGVFNCKARMTGVNKHKCTGCEIEYCLKHRAHETHPCTSEEYVEIIDSEERKQEIINFLNPPKLKKGTESSEKKNEEEEEKKVGEIPANKTEEEVIKKRVTKEKSATEENVKNTKIVTKKAKKSNQPLYQRFKQDGVLETLNTEYIEPFRKYKFSSEITFVVAIILVFVIIENAF